MGAFEPHVIAVEWMGINNLSGTMNEISGGMTNLTRQSQSMGRQGGAAMGYWAQQANIARRSMEYMVAGMGAYKVIQAFQNFKQFRSELGTLNANLQVGQDQINQWGQAAIDISNRTATPLNQVVESFQNLAASFPELSQKAKQHLFPVMAEIEAKAANILSSGGQSVAPQQLGSVVLQAARSFYGAQAVTRSVAANPRNNLVEQTANQIVTALMRTPGTTGSQLVGYLPTLYGGARAGKFTMPEAMAMFNVAQRVGGRPAQTIQYLRQFMLRLRRPTAQEQPYFQQAFQARGMNINQIGSYSGWQIMMALLHHAASLPGGVTPTQIRKMMAQGNTQGVNLTGPAAQFLQNAIGGRIQSLVAITQLSTGLGDLNKQVDTYTHHLVDVNKAYDKWLAQNQLQNMSNQISNATTSWINSFNPVFNNIALFGTHLARYSTDVLRYGQRFEGFMNRHTGGNFGRAVTGAETFGLAYAIRAGMPPGIGNALGRIPGIGKYAKILFQMTNREKGMFGRIFRGGATAAEEAGTVAEENALTRGPLMSAFGKAIAGPLDIRAIGSALSGMANGTPSAPFWVVIHPLSKATVPELFGYGRNLPTGGNQSIEQQVANKLKPVLGPAAGYGARVAQKAGGLGALLERLGVRAAPRFGGSWAADALGSGWGGTLFGGITGGVSTGIAASLIWPGNAGVGQRPGYISMGDYIRRIRSGGGLDRYIRASRGNIPAGILQVLSEYASRRISEPRATADISRYLSHNLRQGLTERMSRNQASSFYKYMDPIFNLGNRTSFIHRAMQPGGFTGYADLVVELQPSQELQGLLSTKQRKVHVRVPITNTPTQRGGRPTTRRGSNK